MKSILDHLGLVTVGTDTAWAVTSPDDRYRYLLGRAWEPLYVKAEVWVFCMLNPSKARIEDDPTVRKCIGFAKRHGASGLLVVNTMAYSTPYPKELTDISKAGTDVYGEHNDAAIAWALEHRPELLRRRFLAAWGIVPPKLRRSALATTGIHAFLAGTFVECFGLNADGTPRHPLMLGYDTPILPYEHAMSAA